MNDNNNIKSVQLYHHFLENIQLFIEETVSTPIDANTLNKITESERIFLLGKGSSAPAILFLTQELKHIFPLKRIDYISDFSLIENNLTHRDLIILNSYSASTSDATDILNSDKYLNLILISANIEKKIIPNKQISFLELYPKDEKLFSRPASMITAYVIACQIISKLKKSNILPVNKIIFLLKQQFKIAKIINPIHETEHISVLSNGEDLPFAFALSLALNEGICKKADYFSIDEFIHGWWVSMFAKPNKYTFIFLNSKSKKLAKIENFLRSSKINLFFFDNLGQDKYETGLLYLFQTAYLVDGYNQKFNYDMNNPIGKQAIKAVY
ncbi:MAG: hypothetical protein H6774_00590 [Pseudomonadales bacterium]|nr:hypothetical protein [Pseudomonadales bacterium]